MKAFDLQVTGSLVVTGSIKTTDGTFILSGSDSNASSSFSTRVTTNESNITLATASIAALTASISRLNTEISTDDTDMTLATASIALNESNMTLATASIAAITASIADNLDQAVKQASAVTFATVDTGQGANELYDMNQNVKTDSNVTFGVITSGDINSSGTITATEIHTTFVSSSITVASGSNTFGDSTDDHHSFTGSLSVSSSLAVTGSATVVGTLTADEIGAFTAAGAIDFGDQNMTNVDIDSGDITGITFGTATSTIISGSTTAVSSSIATRFDSREVDMTLATASIAAITSSIGGIVGGEALLISGSVASTGSFGDGRFAGKVGIGTTAPASALHIEGANNTLSEIRLVNTAATPDTQFVITPIYNVNRLAIRAMDSGGTAASEIITFVSGSGNVGIGETAPANLLHVKASDVGVAPVDTALLVLEKSGTNYLQFLGAAGNTQGIFFGDDDIDIGKIIYNHADNSMAFTTNTTERMRIDSSGNVGIGCTPNEKLTVDVGSKRVHVKTVDGNAGISATDDANSADTLRLHGYRVDIGKDSGMLYVKESGNVGIGTTAPAEILHLNSSTAGGDTTIRLDHSNSGRGNFYLRSKNSGNQNWFVIGEETDGDFFTIMADNDGSGTGAGNVGIGTDSPLNLLHISQASANTAMRIGNNGNYDQYLYFNGGSDWSVGMDYSNTNAFSIANASSLGSGHKLVITTAGDVGIGTDSPTAKLNVLQSAANGVGLRVECSEGTVNASDVAVQIAFSGDGDASGAHYIRFIDGTGSAAVGSVSGATGTTVAFNTSSDYRLKTDLKDLLDATDTINKLKLYNFKWKNDGTRSDGIIAHEVQQVYSQPIFGDKDAVEIKTTTLPDGTIKEEEIISSQMVDYSKFVPLLLKAVQELSSQVTELKKELKS